MIFLVLLLFIFVSLCQTDTQIIAIQNTNETYFTYVPLTPCPIPANSTIQSGAVNYILLDPLRVFEIFQLTDAISFWQVVKNGLSVLADENQLLQNGTYSQVVYFNSSVTNDFSSRQFILTSYTPEGNIVMNYATAKFNQLGNITLNIQYNVTTNFSIFILRLIRQCFDKGLQLQIIYIGAPYFLALCPSTTTLFSFDPQQSKNTFVYNLNYSSFDSLAPNPNQLIQSDPLAPTQQTSWNVAILVGNGTTTLFCNANELNLTCKGFQEDIGWLELIALRAWGLQQAVQQQQVLSVITMFPQISNFNFIGSITSVFIQGITIYVESALNDQIYMAVFNEGTLLANTSLIGDVLYYGQEKLIVQVENGSLFIASFTLPYTTITNNNQQSSFTVEFECQGFEYNTSYEIFWTNSEYPSGFVIQLNNTQQVSKHGVYTYYLEQQYEVIGPGFQVFIQNNSTLDIALLSAPILFIADRITAIIQIQYFKSTIPQLPLVIYFLNDFGHLKTINTQTQKTDLLGTNPCNKNSSQAGKKIGSQYLIKTGDTEWCLCPSNYQNCSVISSSTAASMVQSSDLSFSQKNNILFSNPSSKGLFNLGASNNNELKQQLYDLFGEGMIVNVYMSGVIQLVGVQGTVYSSIQSSCTYNGTNGLIFSRNFYDSFFLIFCDQGATFSQYIIRLNQFIFNKQVPLYGFIMRNNGNYITGSNYIFLEVDIDTNYATPFNELGYTQCCVLRINPNAFTVSAISEIVQARSIVLVESVAGVDIAYYNQTGISQGGAYLKVYFSQSWVSFTQNTVCTTPIPCLPTTYNYYISFASLIYNFAATFYQQILFDLTPAALIANSFPISTIIFKPQISNNPTYIATQVLDLNFICGPIMQYKLTSQSLTDEGTIFSIDLNSIITRNKLLQNFQSSLLQVIDLGKVLPDTVFENLIMLVQSTQISFYLKYDGTWLSLLQTVDSPLTNCLFFLNNITNSTSVNFASNCYNLNIPSLVIILLYQPPTLNISFSQSILPAPIRNIISIPMEQQNPLLFGLSQEPSKSITGILTYCQDYCGQLSISSKISFVMDYDAALFDWGILVVSLDIQSLSFWISPSPPSVFEQLIPSNYTLIYSQKFGLYCDSISIVNSPSENQMNLLLSCPSAYYKVFVNLLTQSITIQQQFSKFSNCDQVDTAKPIFIANGNSITLLIAECLNNKETVRTEQFQTINSSTTTIVTAYLQVYVPFGPICGKSLSPIRILPLSVALSLNSYILYYANGALKLLYQQINGMVVDAFINTSPYANLSLTLLTKQQIFPTLNLTIFNPYYELSFTIATAPQQTFPNLITAYVVEALFLGSNALTLVCLICWICFRRRKRMRERTHARYEVRGLNSDQSSSSRRTQQLNSQRDADDVAPIVSTRIPLPPSIAHRGTEIQLFQPRSKPAS